MTLFHHHHQDTLRQRMQALAINENAALYKRDAKADSAKRIRAALTLAPMSIPQLADLAKCSPVTAQRALKAMFEEGVVVRKVVRNGAGGMAYLYALRPGVVA